MKTLITLIIVLFSTQALALDLSAPDKQKHMIGSALIGAATGIIAVRHDGMSLESGSIAFGIAMIPGLVKEGLDSRSGGSGWDNEDLAADAIGVAVGLICVKIGYNLFFKATSNSLQIGMVF